MVMTARAEERRETSLVAFGLMLAIAAGGTTNEIEHLRKTGSYEFPVVNDEPYTVHKLMGEPRTPFTLLVDREGKVLFAHLGIIEDVDNFYQQIMELVK